MELDKLDTKAIYNMLDTTQLNYKIITNSFYGVTGTSASRFYIPQIAISITLFGQEMILTCKRILEENGYEILYSDSVTGDTLVPLYDKFSETIKYFNIESLFNDDFIKSLGGEISRKSMVDNKELTFLKNIYTYTIKKSGKIVLTKINYVMRHLISKQLYEVVVSVDPTLERRITVTEDHSIYIYIENYDGEYDIEELKLKTVTPKDILELSKKHEVKCVTLNPKFEVIELGKVKEVKPLEIKSPIYVYDISCSNRSMFFGNFILVHNTDSTFIHLTDLIPEEIRQDKEKSIRYIQENLIPKLYEIINPEIERFAKKWNIDPSILSMKQELIGDKIIFFFKRDRKEGEDISAKKRYIAHIVNEEGIDVDKLVVRGLEIRRSELSREIKEKIKDIYEYIVKTDDPNIKKRLIVLAYDLKKYIRKKIKERDIDAIGINISIKDIESYKGNTPQYRGLLLYNIIADIYKLPKMRSVIKGKMIYIKLLKSGSKSKIFDKIVNGIKFYNPSKGKEEILTPRKINSIVIDPQVKDILPEEIWNEIVIDEEKMLNRLFYSPLTPLFDLFGIKDIDLEFERLKIEENLVEE